MKSLSAPKRLAGVIAILALMTFLAFSCKKPSYYKLTSEDLSWMVYDDAEQIKFSNGGALQQTIVVKLRQRYYEHDDDLYEERTGAVFGLAGDTTNYPLDSSGELYLAKSDQGLAVLFSWPHFPIAYYPLHTATQQIATIDGTVYSDIIIIDASLITDSRRYVKMVWYSRSIGVVQYEDIYGNTWNLIN